MPGTKKEDRAKRNRCPYLIVKKSWGKEISRHECPPPQKKGVILGEWISDIDSAISITIAYRYEQITIDDIPKTQ